MSKHNYKSMFHIYFIFFFVSIVIFLISILFFIQVITIQDPNGNRVRSNWPKLFTENISNYILLDNGEVGLKEEGKKLLIDNQVGLQILNVSGEEIFAFQTSANVPITYSQGDLLNIYQNHQLQQETTSLIGTYTNNEKEYVYLVHFPMKLQKVIMYLNGEQFTKGKTIIFILGSAFLLLIIIGGIIYGFYMTKTMTHLMTAIQDISKRIYQPKKNTGTFEEVYKSLNRLDHDIKLSDQTRLQTEKSREEWIANISHDLKTPLSPIKGYGEILAESKDSLTAKRAGIILKNADYIEMLINDLKLTYQLDNGMIILDLKTQDMVRFMKEIVIDILNDPQFIDPRIIFESKEEKIDWQFDSKLLRRAFTNLIINAFVHGNSNTEVHLTISRINKQLEIIISDNGPGMTQEQVDHLFERYYRGGTTKQKTEGTGLGLAITKEIIAYHHGKIEVSSIVDKGSQFHILFPLIKEI